MKKILCTFVSIMLMLIGQTVDAQIRPRGYTQKPHSTIIGQHKDSCNNLKAKRAHDGSRPEFIVDYPDHIFPPISIKYTDYYVFCDLVMFRGPYYVSIYNTSTVKVRITYRKKNNTRVVNLIMDESKTLPIIYRNSYGKICDINGRVIRCSQIELIVMRQ